MKESKFEKAKTVDKFSLQQYKRFIQWFKETMVEGMEPAHIGEQGIKMMGEREGIRRDTTGFYGEGHDFSIVLYKKEKKAARKL